MSGGPKADLMPKFIPLPPGAEEARAETKGESALQKVCREVLGGQRLIIASNRGPVTYERDEQGHLTAKRGSGGVVTALSALTDYTPVSWVAAALSDGDREVAEGAEPPDQKPNLRLHFVNINPTSFDQYLNVISNPLLWFVQHEMDDLLTDPLSPKEIGRAWRQGYVRANEQFAQAIVAEADQPDAAPYVILHDYQLYLAPAGVRRERPDLNLLHFTHIPWPEPAVWQTLPTDLVRSICEALLACDIVGFQTFAAVRAFAHTCQEFLENVRTRRAGSGAIGLEWGSKKERRLCLVRAYPISVDPAQVRKTYEGKAAQRWRERLGKLRQNDQRLIVRVDRLDPNKNVLAGFEAYQLLLEKHPDWQGRVTFLTLLVPTRESVAEYAAYKDQVFDLINGINARFGNAHWQPIRHIYGNDYGRALAALSLADVVLVNSVADGMNLVAKEASLVSEQQAVLVLSRQAGAWEELGEAALDVDPEDRSATAAALYQALTMPAEERSKRATELAEIVEKNDLSGWLIAHLRDLAAIKTRKDGTHPSLVENAGVVDG